MSDQEPTNRSLLAHWSVLDQGLQNLDRVQPISGWHLNIATVVLFAQHIAPVTISEGALNGINDSAEAFKAVMAEESVIYGVNTGFGGSADTRTTKSEGLKDYLLNGSSDYDYDYNKRVADVKNAYDYSKRDYDYVYNNRANGVEKDGKRTASAADDYDYEYSKRAPEAEGDLDYGKRGAGVKDDYDYDYNKRASTAESDYKRSV